MKTKKNHNVMTGALCFELEDLLCVDAMFRFSSVEESLLAVSVVDSSSWYHECKAKIPTNVCPLKQA